jgi:sporulation protein YlmC with PRC-barrel domain
LPEVKDPKDTSGRLIAASMVSGTSVYNPKYEKLGSVHDVMIDKTGGNIAYAIMSFGGFLGIGDRYHPLPWSTLAYDEAVGGYVVDIDRDRLEGAPAYVATDPDVWADPTYRATVDGYYGI